MWCESKQQPTEMLADIVEMRYDVTGILKVDRVEVLHNKNLIKIFAWFDFPIGSVCLYLTIFVIKPCQVQVLFR